MKGDCFSAFQVGGVGSVSRRRTGRLTWTLGRGFDGRTAACPVGRGERRTPCGGVPIGLEPTPPASLFASTGGRGQISHGAGERLRGERLRASDLLALSEMIQEALDHGGLGDVGRDGGTWSRKRLAAFSHELPVLVDEVPAFLTSCGARRRGYARFLGPGERR
jgi:hypothetical protein